MQLQAPRVAVGIAAAISLGLAAAGCGDDGKATTSARPVSQDTAAAVAEAGVVTLDDLNAGERPDHLDRWSREEPQGYELFTEQGGCFAVDTGEPAEEFRQGLLAADSSDVYETADDRGPTLVSIATRTDTLVYDSQDAAQTELRRLDGAYLVSCIERTGAAKEAAGSTEEGCDDCEDEFVADDDVEATEIDAPEAGDEGVAFLAVYDNDTGEGDDNYSSAEIHAVRTGQVVEVVYAVRFGEGHEDDVVAEPTTGLLPTIDILVDRIVAASTGDTTAAPTPSEKVAADAAGQGMLTLRDLPDLDGFGAWQEGDGPPDPDLQSRCVLTDDDRGALDPFARGLVAATPSPVFTATSGGDDDPRVGNARSQTLVYQSVAAATESIAHLDEDFFNDCTAMSLLAADGRDPAGPTAGYYPNLLPQSPDAGDESSGVDGSIFREAGDRESGSYAFRLGAARSGAAVLVVLVDEVQPYDEDRDYDDILVDTDEVLAALIDRVDGALRTGSSP